MSKRMAYLMHVDWNWIKQRPHFLAEQLAGFYDVDLFYIRNYAIKGLVKNKCSEKFKSKQSIKKIPLSRRVKLFKHFEKLINKPILDKLYLEEYDYMWITSPVILAFIDFDRIVGKHIIYDCMDDVLEFYEDERMRNYLLSLEKKLLEKADVVFASSKYLKKVIEERASNKEVIVVNNGVEEDSFLKPFKKQKRRAENKKLFNIVYFGTISKWFDFEILKQLLHMHDDIEFTLIGPTKVKIPRHERINFIGPIEHSQLKDYTYDADAFIMPFKLNKLILAVDPVKIYEYIALRKPSFVVRYEETLKFEGLVYLYGSVEELSENILKVKNKKEIIDENNIKQFIEKNCWEERVHIIQDYLNEKIFK